MKWSKILHSVNTVGFTVDLLISSLHCFVLCYLFDFAIAAQTVGFLTTNVAVLHLRGKFS